MGLEGKQNNTFEGCNSSTCTLTIKCNVHSVLYIEWEIYNSEDPGEMRSAQFAIMKIIFCKLNSFEIKCHN